MYFNRDLSWLGFNHRVLQEAMDDTVPLYERLKYLAIFSSNLDEFFRVRYPLIIALSKLSDKEFKKESLFSESGTEVKVQDLINESLDEFGNTLINHLIPELKKENIFLYYHTDIKEEHLAACKQLFLSSILSFIQPFVITPENLVNFIPDNNQLYLIVTVKNSPADTISHIMINIPSNRLFRFLVLDPIGEMRYVVFIDDIIRHNIPLVLPNKEVIGIYSVKFNQDADIQINDEYSSDLLAKMERSLLKRTTAATSRFLFESTMPVNLRLFLSSALRIAFSDMFPGGHYHNLSDLFSFPLSDPSLQYPRQQPLLYPSPSQTSLFEMIRKNDILLHMPYQSYHTVLSFFNQAAVDPEVVEISITLYRVAADSHIANALISAAKNGKKVTAFIELKARFDEANNIKWSRLMKKAGVKLIYSEASIKVHSKIALVKRKKDSEQYSYALISTGNFNENTALFYTDHVLFTCDKVVIRDLNLLFEYMQKEKKGHGKSDLKLRKLLVSQFNLVPGFEQLVEAEITKAKNGVPALIRIKVNNLEEKNFIQLLYKAASAGVIINLVVRSICCLVPGVVGVSENITVKRIVDRYLEHSRIFIFGAGEDANVIIGSADLMARNLYRRIEVCLPVTNEKARKQLIAYFQMQWNDNVKASTIQKDGSMIRDKTGGEIHRAQHDIYSYLLTSNQ